MHGFGVYYMALHRQKSNIKVLNTNVRFQHTATRNHVQILLWLTAVLIIFGSVKNFGDGIFGNFLNIII